VARFAIGTLRQLAIARNQGLNARYSRLDRCLTAGNHHGIQIGPYMVRHLVGVAALIEAAEESELDIEPCAILRVLNV